MADGFVTRRGGGGIDVSDATATENDVLQGETFYSGDTNIKTGNIPSKGAETFTPTTSNQTISSGQYLSGTQTILGDPDLVPENIAEGVTIFGVTGTAEIVPPLIIPTYVQGVDRAVNGSTYLFFAREANNGSGSCTSGSPSAYAYFDLRGIAINSIDFVFDFRYYNSQPRIGTRSAAPTTTITFDGAKNQWLITDLTEVDYENLYSTYGASGSATNVSRSYTYSGRTDLILQIGVGSCQAITDRYVGIRSLNINGTDMLQFADNNNQTTVSA